MTHRKYVTSIAEVPFANIHLLRNFTLLEKPFQAAQVFFAPSDRHEISEGS
jgi:hypothetical protein